MPLEKVFSPLVSEFCSRLFVPEVFKGRWRQQTVAVKVLRLADEEAERLFFRELEIMASLRSPNVVTPGFIILFAVALDCVFAKRLPQVQFFGACTKTKPYFLIMEYMDGGSLDKLLARNPDGLPVEQVVQIAQDVLLGSVFMHSNKIIHRDLKPHNILFDSSGRVKLGGRLSCR